MYVKEMIISCQIRLFDIVIARSVVRLWRMAIFFLSFPRKRESTSNVHWIPGQARNDKGQKLC